MSGRVKVFGLALVASLAMSAVISSLAVGAGAYTSLGGAGQTISGSQIGESVFTTTHGSVKCSTGTFAGTTTATISTEMKLTQTYTGCKLAGLSATVNVKSCFYRYTAGETEESENKIGGTAHLECTTAGDAITISVTGSKCVITIPPQTMENGITTHSVFLSTRWFDLFTRHTVSIDYNIDEPTACPNPSDVTAHAEEKLASYTGEFSISTPAGLKVH